MIVYEIVVLFLVFSYIFIFLFYLFGWITLPPYILSESIPQTKVSVIISARNEEENIELLLRDLIQQSYPADLFEIIVVDDFSVDRTVEIVRSIGDSKIKLLELKNFVSDKEPIASFKKKAIEIGIANSAGDLIVTTDADCRMNSSWLKTLVNFYEEKSCHMIVAPVLMNDEAGFFKKFQALDFIGLMGITGATLNLSFPTMCNGANLAFQRKSFYEVKGYEGISNNSSGDDMLLMHKISSRWKRGVEFLKGHDAVVYTASQKKISSFIEQRMRWTSKSQSYSDWKIKANLLIIYLFNFSIPVSLALSLFEPGLLMIFLFQVVTKLVLDFVFLSEVTKFFNCRRLLWLFLPIEAMHVLYIIVVGFAGNFFRTNWKGRSVK